MTTTPDTCPKCPHNLGFKCKLCYPEFGPNPNNGGFKAKTLPVVYRKFPQGDVIALIGNVDPKTGNVICFQFQGEHGEIRATEARCLRKASESEYKALHAYLCRRYLPEYELVIRRKVFVEGRPGSAPPKKVRGPRTVWLVLEDRFTAGEVLTICNNEATAKAFVEATGLQDSTRLQERTVYNSQPPNQGYNP